ncbi:MAG TPA: TIGR03067 domain-containing protein [Vicinamibacterales bacterium]
MNKDKRLPARPNLEHLRRQAKVLLPTLRERHPAARLADAQLAVARESGFASWPRLSRYVDHLRGLEGEWRFETLDVEGSQMPASMLAHARLLIDGDRFRTESPEATYDGVFTIDVDEEPARIDITFVEGPEAGNTSLGLYQLDGDRLTICLSVGAAGTRPASFATVPGSGHALEQLRRASAARPASVTGGTPPAASPVSTGRADPADFDVPASPVLRRLEGEWIPVELVMDGKPMPAEWLTYGSRTARGNEVKVVFGGQTMVHAKVRIDESASPVAVDYLTLAGKQQGTVTHGILEWIGDEVRILMAGPGDPRPPAFGAPARTATLSRWRRR